MTTSGIFGFSDPDDFDTISHSEDDIDEYVVTDQNMEEPDTQSRRIKNTSYVYTALNELNTDISTMSSEIESVVLLMYKINTEGKYPFLEFGMGFSSDTHLYHFVEYEKKDMLEILHDKSDVHGFIERGSKAYVWYPVADSIELNTMMKTFIPNMHFLLGDELVNGKQVLKCNIHEDVTTFFKMHPHFLFLHSTTNDVFEMPVVAYHGTKNKNIRFVSQFGVGPAEILAPFGVGYYFTDFENAKRRANRQSVTRTNPAFNIYKSVMMEKGIVCRFALFPGKMKVLLNNPNDEVDQSSTKQELLNSHDTSHRAKMTMRITDHDGVWKNNYDSMYVGKIELDDGSRFEEGPLWGLKDFDQQLFLTYQLC